MNNGRLILEDTTDPVRHLATLEAVWRSIDELTTPTTLILRRLSPCVLIGCSQDPEQEVNINECKRKNIPIVRRPSEGGAIYCDQNCLIFSLIFHQKNDTTSHKNLQMWGDALAKGFQRLGIEVHTNFEKPNDILINGKKVAGLTLTDWYNVRSFSGAILIDIDLPTIEAVLTPGIEKLKRHNSEHISDRITSLRQSFKRNITHTEVENTVKEIFSKECNCSFIYQNLSHEELQQAGEIERLKYKTPSWNYFSTYEVKL